MKKIVIVVVSHGARPIECVMGVNLVGEALVKLLPLGLFTPNYVIESLSVSLIMCDSY